MGVRDDRASGGERGWATRRRPAHVRPDAARSRPVPPPVPDRLRVRSCVRRARPRPASRAPCARCLPARREDAAVARKNDDYYRRPCAHLALAQHRRPPRGHSPPRHIRSKGNINASPRRPGEALNSGGARNPARAVCGHTRAGADASRPSQHASSWSFSTAQRKGKLTLPSHFEQSLKPALPGLPVGVSRRSRAMACVSRSRLA
jgi:hypothetical protein